MYGCQVRIVKHFKQKEHTLGSRIKILPRLSPHHLRSASWDSCASEILRQLGVVSASAECPTAFFVAWHFLLKGRFPFKFFTLCSCVAYLFLCDTLCLRFTPYSPLRTSRNARQGQKLRCLGRQAHRHASRPSTN